MGLRMKNFNIMRVHWKIRILGGFHKENIQGELALKGGEGGGAVLGEFADLRREGGLDGVLEWGGVDTPMHAMYLIWCLYG